MTGPTERILGIDLAGPAHREATALAELVATDGSFALTRLVRGLDDRDLAALLADAGGEPLIVGLDAPLSYQPGGGDRAGDRTLRRRLQEAGLAPGTVMPPTMARMVHLTLRGLAVARLVAALRPAARIVEVHPAGALALRAAPIAAVRELKRSATARRELVAWLAEQGVAGLPAAAPTDHEVAALAAAVAARDWAAGRACWSAPAEPPLHPYDYAC